MAGQFLQSDFWVILGVALLAVWPAALLLGRAASALSGRAHPLALQATAGTLLLCLLAALLQGCLKTVLWAMLPPLWLVFLTGEEKPRPFIQWRRLLADWATGAGVFALWAFLAGYFLRIWSPAPFNPYIDLFFYSRTAMLLGQTGVETSLQELLHFLPGSVAGPTPYHYAELWLAGGLGRLTGVSPAAWLEFAVWPLLLTLATLWLTELLGRRLARPLVQRILLACLMIMAVSAGTVLPGTGKALSVTHRYLSDYGLTHFYGIKLLWLCLSGLGVWAGWQPRVPPLYQPSLGWLLLVPLLNVVFPLVVLAGAVMGFLAFRRSFHLPSMEVTLATILTSLWFIAFYLFSGGLAEGVSVSHSQATALAPTVRAIGVEVLQAQNVLGYWTLVKAAPLILLFLPDLKWPFRLALAGWAALVALDLLQPFPYASAVSAAGMTAGSVWLAWHLHRRSECLALLPVLTILLAPLMVVMRSLPDAHQFFYLPAAAAFFVLFWYGFIRALSAEDGRIAVSLLLILACLGAVNRNRFVQTNHFPVDSGFLTAWTAKGWNLGPESRKGIYFSGALPPADSFPATRPLQDLEWVLPGSYLTDASPYAADPTRILPHLRGFVEMLPFRQYCRRNRQGYGPCLVGFCVQNRVGLALVPKGRRLPPALSDRATDSLSTPAYNLYRLNTGR